MQNMRFINVMRAETYCFVALHMHGSDLRGVLRLILKGVKKVCSLCNLLSLKEKKASFV